MSRDFIGCACRSSCSTAPAKGNYDKAGVAGAGTDTFNRPSAVTTGPNGDIFVADGHGGESNERIVKFSKDGKFIKAWGKRGIYIGSVKDGVVKALIPGLGSNPATQ